MKVKNRLNSRIRLGGSDNRKCLVIFVSSQSVSALYKQLSYLDEKVMCFKN